MKNNKQTIIMTIIMIATFLAIFLTGCLLGWFLNFSRNLELIGRVSKYEIQAKIWHERFLYCEDLLKR